MAVFSTVRELDVDGPLRGAFVGGTFVASWQEDGRDLLAKWTSRDASPELVTPLDPRVVALAASPAGERVAIAGVASDAAAAAGGADDADHAREVAELLVATLAPPSGVRLVQPRAGLTFEREEPPRLLWSDDGRHLALGGLLGTSADHVITMVFDVRASAAKPSVVFGRPVQWQGARLCVALGDTRTGWDAAEDAEAPWDGTLRFAAPDGTATVTRAPDGAVTIATSAGDARPLVTAPSSLVWVGPHHLATDDGRALDVLTRQPVDLLPRAPRSTAPPSLIALAPDGSAAVFEREGGYVWATRA